MDLWKTVGMLKKNHEWIVNKTIVFQLTSIFDVADLVGR